MSIDGLSRNVHQAMKDLAHLQDQKSREARAVAEEMKKAAAASEAAARSTSATTRTSRTNDAVRHQELAARHQAKAGAIEQQIARAHGRLADAQTRLSAAHQQEAKQQDKDAKRQAEEAKRRDQEARRRVDDAKRLAADHERLARDQQRRLQSMSATLQQHESLHFEAFNMIESLRRLPEEIVVLVLAASPPDQDHLRLDEEVRSIGEMIRKSTHRDAVKLESRWAVRPLDILQAVNELKPAVIHFSGHGSSNGELVFQDDRGRSKVVTQDAIVQSLAVSGDVRLVFLNACHSRRQAEALIEHVDAAIGMRASIGDRAARVFASQFYSAIGFGLSVQNAFLQARAALMLEGIPEETSPELFVRAGLDAAAIILVAPREVGDA